MNSINDCTEGEEEIMEGPDSSQFLFSGNPLHPILVYIIIKLSIIISYENNLCIREKYFSF